MDIVSVIVPVFNVEHYLQRCLNSIINQTYANLEIILVDDGSTDNSGKICDQYSKMDKRISVIHQRNMGQSEARNRGLDIAQGEWITFVDSDDFIAPDYVEYLLQICLSYGVSIAQCGVVRGTQDIFPKEKVTIKEKKWEFYDLYTSSGREFRAIVCAKIYRANLFDDYRFPVGKIFEDEDAAFKVMYMAGSSAISNRHLYYYFMSENSTLRTKREHIRLDFVDIFEERIQYLKNREETFLIEVTKKELCIRLMLEYCNAKKNKIEKEEIKEIREKFIQYYDSITKKHFITFREKIALLLFYMFPHSFAFFENNISIIKKVKYFREKR